SQPIGGVIVYDGQISPSGVGFDIARGNKAVKTNLLYTDIQTNIASIMDKIAGKVQFGVGKSSGENRDHPIFEDTDWDVYKGIGKDEHEQLRALARNELGTTESSNHYVDLLVETKTEEVWIANHFASTRLGNRTATGLFNFAVGRTFSDKPKQTPRQTK